MKTMKRLLTLLCNLMIVLSLVIMAPTENAEAQNLSNNLSKINPFTGKKYGGTTKCPDFAHPDKLQGVPRMTKVKQRPKPIPCEEDLKDDVDALSDKINDLEDDKDDIKDKYRNKRDRKYNKIDRKHGRVAKRVWDFTWDPGKKCFSKARSKSVFCFGTWSKTRRGSKRENLDDRMDRQILNIKSDIKDINAAKYEKLADINEQIFTLKQERKRLSNLRTELCTYDPDRPKNGCPRVQEIFLQTPTKANFEQMIKTVGGVTYAEDKKEGTAQYVVVTLDNYSEVKKQVNDDKKEDALEVKKEIAEKAWDQYEKNLKAKDGDKKNFNSVCGGCRVLYQSIKEKSKAPTLAAEDTLEIKDLIALGKQVSCDKVPGIVNCESEMKKAKDNKNDFDTNLDNFLNKPTINKNKLLSSYDKFSKMVGENGAACVSCDNLTKKLDELMKETISKGGIEGVKDFDNYEGMVLDLATMEETDDDYKKTKEEIYSVQNQVMEKNEKYKSLYAVAQDKTCVSPVPKTNNSCEEVMLKVKQVANEEDRGSEDDLSIQEQEDLNQAKDKQCCTDPKFGVLDGLRNSAMVSNDFPIVKILKGEDPDLKLARMLGCVDCWIKGEDSDDAGNGKAEQKPFSCNFFAKKVKEIGLKGFESQYVRNCTEIKESNGCSKGNALFAQSAYSTTGKYGDLKSTLGMDMKCYCDPEDDRKPAIDYTCCLMDSAEGAAFKEDVKNKTDIAAKSGSFICGQKVQDSSTTLCNQIKGGCNKKWSEFQVGLVGICKDIEGVELGRIFSTHKSSRSQQEKNMQVPTSTTKN